MRQTFLKTDFSSSNTLVASYDADLENFWTQKSNFIFSTPIIEFNHIILDPVKFLFVDLRMKIFLNKTILFCSTQNLLKSKDIIIRNFN